jgi:hypothetical protein
MEGSKNVETKSLSKTDSTPVQGGDPPPVENGSGKPG